MNGSHLTPSVAANPNLAPVQQQPAPINTNPGTSAGKTHKSILSLIFLEEKIFKYLSFLFTTVPSVNNPTQQTETAQPIPQAQQPIPSSVTIPGPAQQNPRIKTESISTPTTEAQPQASTVTTPTA